MDIELTCPLGAKCEEIRANKMHRCRWYKELAGTDAQGKEVNQFDCSLAWLPTLMIEIAGTNRGQTKALESMRNETVIRQDAALKVIGGA